MDEMSYNIECLNKLKNIINNNAQTLIIFSCQHRRVELSQTDSFQICSGVWVFDAENTACILCVKKSQ